jgi:dimethylargininase
MASPVRVAASVSRLAFTRGVTDAIVHCELTHRQRVPIDVGVARAQHERYEEALRAVGCAVQRVDPAADLPDAVFVEDAAVVVDEIAVMTRPGAKSRRAELPAVERALAPHRPLARIVAPATLDGGDVLVAARHVFVGHSSRSNAAGAAQLAAVLRPFGYVVTVVPVRDCLHLKSAVTALSDTTLLVNRDWVAVESFRGFDLLDVHPLEPFAANVLRIGNALIYPAEFPRTQERIERRGRSVHAVPAAELAKAEGGVTCCSVLVAIGGGGEESTGAIALRMTPTEP